MSESSAMPTAFDTKIGPVVHGQVRHHLRTTFDRQRTYDHVKAQPVAFTRPSDGSEPARTVLRCGQCDERLTYRVYSARGTRTLRRRWGLLALACLAVGVVLGGYVASVAGRPAEEVDSLVVGAAVIGVMIAVGCAFYFGASVRSDERGVRGPGRPHSFTPPPLTRVYCGECGHREYMRDGGSPELDARDMRRARRAFERHVCGQPGTYHPL
ncbi:MAG: hypothetical protein WCA46_24325 [Actinocatenispora sp.]